MALVSVIVPAFNAAPWIQECLRSVLSQSWRELDVLVVDDGSTDETAAVAKAINDPRVRVLRQANRGAASARNVGLAEASGEWIQYLDADDLLGECKLERQLAALELSPAGSVASCPWIRFETTPDPGNVRPEPVWTEADPVQWMVTSLGGGGMMHPNAWLVPRTVAERAGPWDERLSLHDDGDYFSRILLHSTRNVFVSDVCVYYRDVPGSLSRRRSRAAVESALAVCDARCRYLLHVRDDNRVRSALATQYAQFAYEFSGVAPDLVEQALAAMDRLGVPPARSVGGRQFRWLARTLGYRAACQIRQWMPARA